MIPASKPIDEEERIETLRRFAILDTENESAFDRVTDFAAKQFDVPIAIVSLVDEDRQWFKSACGLDASETPRDLAFCAYTILGDGIHYVPDATQDPRFAKNPLVTGELGIRFYCGAPLIASNGHRLGSLCLIDTVPRHGFPETEQLKLADLAAIVVGQMEMRIATGNVLTEIESRRNAQQFAAATERQMSALIENVPVGIALFDTNGDELTSSRVWRELAEVKALATSKTARDIRRAFIDALRGKTTRASEDCTNAWDGESRCFQWEARPWNADDGTTEGVIIGVTEITEQIKARQELERQTEMLNAVLENVIDGIVACDADGNLTTFNKKTREMHGIDAHKIPIEECAEFYSLYEVDGETVLSPERVPLFAALTSGAVTDREIIIAPDDLPRRHIVAQAVPLYEPNGALLGAVASMTDVTESRAAERKLRESEAHANYVAFHDALTGLPNRSSFSKMLETQQSRSFDGLTAALFLDLNQFKAVNDTLGHKVGDDLLRKTANTLQLLAGEDAFIARLGGDEFIVLKNVTTKQVAMDLGCKIIAAIGEPSMINGHTVATGVSVGLAFGPEHGANYEDLTNRADLAMYNAKQNAANEPVVFDPEQELERADRRAIEADLSKSIDRDELRVFFQPIVCGQTQEVRGVEALVRWNHPTRGLVSPVEFIPIAEETGFIVEMGEWVLRTAMETLKGTPELFLSVNMSPVQFRDALLVQRVFDALNTSGFDPQRLELEITESLLIHDTNIARRTIKTFKTKGIRIALDDFGTGYSSLGYIQSFPFDKIKIDRSFISDIENNSQSAAVVQCVVNLAASLGMTVTAEGIETPSHEMLLKFIGCNTLQGYRYGKPMPFTELTHLLKKKQECNQNSLLPRVRTH